MSANTSNTQNHTAHQTHPEILNNVLVEELCGTAVSSTQVSDGAKLLDAELPKWRDRPLDAYPYLVFDARYEKVRHDGQLRDCAVRIALGITPAGQRASRGAAEQRLKEIVTHDAQSAPKLATWMEDNLPQGFAVFTLPAAHQKRLRTSNALERVNQELKRRTRVARVFPNEKSLLRLISARLTETSDDWETGKIYLNMENQNPPSV